MSKNLSASALQRFTGLKAHPQPSLLRLDTPVVLMHGFGVGGSIRRGGHLHDEAMYLRGRGCLAYAPNVAPYDTVTSRTQMWDQRLRYVLKESGAESLTLIAHSMGGLDARYLISQMGWHEHVNALVTVSTPHRGTAAAEFVLQQPDTVRRWIVDMADWVGTHILEDGTADAHQSLVELTPAYVQDTFNPAVPDHEDVRYFSYGCQAGKDTAVPIDPVFRIFNTYIYEREGVNDGIVSVNSARWGEYHGTVDADHGRQVGYSSGFRTSFDSKTFYAGIVTMLSENGF